MKSNILKWIIFINILFITDCTSRREFLYPESEITGDRMDKSIEKWVDSSAVPSDLDQFSEQLMESKAHYADALIELSFFDSSAAKFEFENAVSMLLEIGEIIPESEDAREDLHRLTETIVNHYVMVFGDSILVNFDFRLSPLEEIPFLEVDEPEKTGRVTVIEDREGHIPLIINQRVQKAIDYFVNKAHKQFQIWLDRSAKYSLMMKNILRRQDMPEGLFFLAMIESGFQIKAYSYAHAAGPWQFISSTGKLYGLKNNYWIDERYDPELSTFAAANYLKDLYNNLDDWYLAMAAYNAGEGRVKRAIRRENTHDFWKLRSLPGQTRQYVPTFLAASIIARDPEHYGFKTPVAQKWDYENYELSDSYDLSELANCLKIKTSDFKEMNPALRRWTSPPNQVTIRISAGKSEEFRKRLKDIKIQQVSNFQYYNVKKGDTISRIAQKYGVSQNAIIRANKMKNRHRIKIKQKLIIPLPGYTVLSTKESLVPSENSIEHIVKKGDTLYDLANQYGTTVSQIRKYNKIRYGKYIFPGQKLIIASVLQSPDEGYFVHTVRSGDTLWEISRTYGVALSRLKQKNPEFADGRLKPGNKIKIYRGKS